jgi:hypothetical protein
VKTPSSVPPAACRVKSGLLQLRRLAGQTSLTGQKARGEPFAQATDWQGNHPENARSPDDAGLPELLSNGLLPLGRQRLRGRRRGEKSIADTAGRALENSRNLGSFHVTCESLTPRAVYWHPVSRVGASAPEPGFGGPLSRRAYPTPV